MLFTKYYQVDWVNNDDIYGHVESTGEKISTHEMLKEVCYFGTYRNKNVDKIKNRSQAGNVATSLSHSQFFSTRSLLPLAISIIKITVIIIIIIIMCCSFIALCSFLGAFAKLRKANLALLCLPVRLSAWNNSAPTGKILMKFYIWVFFRKSVEKIQI